MKNLDLAIDDFQEVVDITNDNADRLILCRALSDSRRFDEAIEGVNILVRYFCFIQA